MAQPVLQISSSVIRTTVLDLATSTSTCLSCYSTRCLWSSSQSAAALSPLCCWASGGRAGPWWAAQTKPPRRAKVWSSRGALSWFWQQWDCFRWTGHFTWSSSWLWAPRTSSLRSSSSSPLPTHPSVCMGSVISCSPWRNSGQSIGLKNPALFKIALPTRKPHYCL